LGKGWNFKKTFTGKQAGTGVNMLYPVYVHMGDENHAHGVTIPDFPGCFSAADDWSSLPAKVQEAVEVYCEVEDISIPEPSSLDDLMKDDNYQGGIWMMLDIYISKLNTRAVRLNISLPANVVAKMDDYAVKHHMTRSALIARAANSLIGE
jgi:predicted RNase H-like HicB family nuclease